MKISRYMINMVRWYCDTYIMGLETGFLFGTALVVQSLRPSLHGQDHISTIWQVNQHSQHIVNHTTRKIDIQNSHEDLQISSWMEEHPNPIQSIWHFVSSGGSPCSAHQGTAIVALRNLATGHAENQHAIAEVLTMEPSLCWVRWI